MAGDFRIPRVPVDMDAIGGYFALEPAGSSEPTFHGQARSFQSARVAFAALLQTVKPRRVWMPWYLCDSMAEPLASQQVAAQRYALGPDFSIAGPVHLEPDDLLLYVNYFGLHDHVLDRLALTYPQAQLVFDNAQAFYSRPRPVLATLYSPRKFLGVPDGGYLWAPTLPIPRYARDADSRSRAVHLFKRHELGAEAGYADFAKAEASLSGQDLLEMSHFTQHLLSQVPHPAVRSRRRENFAFLANRLGPFNQLAPALGDDAVPACYPFLPCGPAGLHRLLWDARIFAARYWPELMEPARATPGMERRWAAELVALPIDQRYTRETLEEYVVRPLEQQLVQP
jgi:hypothetical protein